MVSWNPTFKLNILVAAIYEYSGKKILAKIMHL